MTQNELAHERRKIKRNETAAATSEEAWMLLVHTANLDNVPAEAIIRPIGFLAKNNELVLKDPSRVSSLNESRIDQVKLDFTSCPLLC